jgi:hypothetical protein
VPDYGQPRDLAVVEDDRQDASEDPADPADPGGLGRVYLTTLPDGPLVVLEGSSALIWRQAQEEGDLVTSVARLVGENPQAIRAEVERFVEALVAHGLLEHREG